MGLIETRIDQFFASAECREWPQLSGLITLRGLELTCKSSEFSQVWDLHFPPSGSVPKLNYSRQMKICKPLFIFNGFFSFQIMIDYGGFRLSKF